MRKTTAAVFIFVASTLHSAQDTIEIPEYGLTIPVQIPAEKPPEMECGSKHNIIIDGHKWKGYQICTKIRTAEPWYCLVNRPGDPVWSFEK